MRKSVQKETSVKVSGKTRKNRNGKRTSQCVRKTSWRFVMNYDHTYKTHHKYEIPCWSGKTSCSNTLLLIRWGKILKDSKCIWTIVINLYCSEISMCNYYTSGETDVSGHRHKEDYVSIKMNLNEDICKCPNLRQHVFISVFDRHGGKEATKFCWKQLWDVTPWVVYSSTCQLSIFSSVWWCTFYTFNDAVRYLKYRTQTTECPTVCSPLQVVVNAKGKRRPVLDLRYVNHYLCQSKFKYEGLYLGFVYTTVTTFSSKRASFFYGFTACLHWDVKAKTNELESEAFQKCDEIVFMYMWKTKKHYS